MTIKSTYSGKDFNFSDPKIEEISIVDISHALSRIARYSGHLEGFYSVAQHSVYVSRLSPPDWRLQGLLHDASEAYTGDLITPLTQAVPQLRELKNKIEDLVARKFDIPWPESPEVKRVDKKMLYTEIFWIGNPVWREQYIPYENGYPDIYDIKIETWEPDLAKYIFIAEFLRIHQRLDMTAKRKRLGEKEERDLIREFIVLDSKYRQNEIAMHFANNNRIVGHI